MSVLTYISMKGTTPENTALFPGWIKSLAELEASSLPRSVTTATEEASKLEPVTVQKYADSDIIKIDETRYPSILRTDKPYLLSLHPDDIEAFTRLRNNIGLKIYLNKSWTQFPLAKKDILPLTDRLIGTLMWHGIVISDSGDDWQISWVVR